MQMRCQFGPRLILHGMCSNNSLYWWLMALCEKRCILDWDSPVCSICTPQIFQGMRGHTAMLFDFRCLNSRLKQNANMMHCVSSEWTRRIHKGLGILVMTWSQTWQLCRCVFFFLATIIFMILHLLVMDWESPLTPTNCNVWICLPDHITVSL